MKRIKNTFLIMITIIAICATIYGVGYIKYKIWRAEHPYAKTWTFFIPNSK
jgi:uncharacterized membrane protein YpjA